MKYEGQQIDSTVESYGVIENQVGIDAQNIDFLATLLTSNLYSNPLHSFLRETIANAWDSQIEAGNTNTPVILLIEEIEKEEGSFLNNYIPRFSYKLSIRDFGTGLSKERFEEIYRNIGSSTKRGSNDFIGCFGIGRFSALACKDQVNVTSFYNGKRYNYLMYKNGGRINIDQMSVTDGDFKNGLEVSIENYKTTSSILKEAILQVQFFKKLYVEYKGPNLDFREFIKEFNNRKCYDYNNFAFMMPTALSGNYVKMGSVLYKIDKQKVSYLKTGNSCINVPIGSIDITPNRETIQYTDKTIETINKYYDKAKEELSDIVIKNLSDFDSLVNFYTAVCGNSYKIILDGNIKFINFNDVVIKGEEVKSKIKGVEIPRLFITFIKKVRYINIDKSYIYKSYNTPRRSDADFRGLFAGDWKLAIKKDSRIKEGTLKFFRETHSGEQWRIVSEEGLLMLRALCKMAEIEMGSGDTEECTNFLFSNIEIEEILNSNTPNEYFTKKVITINNEDTIRWYTNEDFRKYSNEKITKIDEVREKRKNGFFIYTTNTKEDKELKNFSKLECNLILGVFTCKESQLKYFENKRIFVRLEDLMSEKNKFFQKLFEANTISINFYESNMTTSQLSKLKIYEQFYKEYASYIGTNAYHFNNLKDLYQEKGWLDQEKINYYAIDNEDIKIQLVLEDLKDLREDVIYALTRNIVFTKTGNRPKIGLTKETVLSKKQIINQINECVEKLLKSYKK